MGSHRLRLTSIWLRFTYLALIIEVNSHWNLGSLGVTQESPLTTEQLVNTGAIEVFQNVCLLGTNQAMHSDPNTVSKWDAGNRPKDTLQGTTVWINEFQVLHSIEI
jgi:hypothetical protein